MAFTSACAVGSLAEVTRLTPVARTSPSLTTTAPKGPPSPLRTFSVASRMARCMKSFSLCMFVPRRRFSLHSPQGCPNIRSMTQAFVSSRVVTPEGVRPAAVIVEEGRIEAVREPGDVRPAALLHSFGDLVLLPGLVDSHVHVNEPGRTEWEAFATATPAAAAGGYTTLVDMPLNCLPEPGTVAALQAKRAAAVGQCRVDWVPWAGLTGQNQEHIAGLAAAAVARS